MAERNLLRSTRRKSRWRRSRTLGDSFWLHEPLLRGGSLQRKFAGNDSTTVAAPSGGPPTNRWWRTSGRRTGSGDGRVPTRVAQRRPRRRCESGIEMRKSSQGRLRLRRAHDPKELATRLPHEFVNPRTSTRNVLQERLMGRCSRPTADNAATGRRAAAVQEHGEGCERPPNRDERWRGDLV